MKKYLLVEVVNAKKEVREGMNGYLVEHSTGGYSSWETEAVFNKYFTEIGDNKINKKTFDSFIAEEVVETQIIFGKPTTVLHVKLRNGMVISDTTTCVDPKNYSEEIGAGILRARVADKIWFGLGFSLQSGLCGVDSLGKGE